MIELKTKFFFDRRVVIDAAEKMLDKAMRKIGAFTRRAARSMIRKSSQISSPGQPPKSHTGVLHDRIQFWYEPSIKTVVIGPEKLITRHDMGDAVPATLEFGGTVKRKTKRGKVKSAHYRPRPYMQPALVKASADMARKAPELWQLIGPGSGFSASVG